MCKWYVLVKLYDQIVFMNVCLRSLFYYCGTIFILLSVLNKEEYYVPYQHSSKRP